MFAKCVKEELFTYAKSAMLLFILPIAFNTTINKCNSANEVIIHFFKMFLELFDKNKLEKLFYQQSTLNLLPNVQVKQQC